MPNRVRWMFRLFIYLQLSVAIIELLPIPLHERGVQSEISPTNATVGKSNIINFNDYKKG